MAKRRNITGVKRKKTKQSSTNQPPNAPTVSEIRTPELSASDEDEISSQMPTAAVKLTKSSEECRIPPYRVSKLYGPMKPKTKHISQSIIRSRWPFMSAGAQVKAEKILRSVELPILARFTTEEKKIEAQRTLQSLIQTLSKRFPKMPFPPRTKEENFDHEMIAKNNQSLLQQCAVSSSSIASLMDEAEQQKAALASDKQELETLKTST